MEKPSFEQHSAQETEVSPEISSVLEGLDQGRLAKLGQQLRELPEALTEEQKARIGTALRLVLGPLVMLLALHDQSAVTYLPEGLQSSEGVELGVRAMAAGFGGIATLSGLYELAEAAKGYLAKVVGKNPA